MTPDELRECELYPDYPVPNLLAHIRDLAEARKALREIGQCGVEFDDERIGYVTVQVDRDLWKIARAALQAPHEQLCFYCGKPTDDLAGDPGQWGVALAHPDKPGVVRWHHAACVSERLMDRAKIEREAHEELERRLADATNAAVRECAKTECTGCKAGMPFTTITNMFHQWAGHNSECSAYRIRIAFPAAFTESAAPAEGGTK